MVYIGIDNGVSGAIGILDNENNIALIYDTPVRKELGYQKTKAKFINRIDCPKLKVLLQPYGIDCKVFIERPMVNPMRFQASVSAVRALEATLIVLEELKIPYSYIDSKAWQKLLLPPKLKGPELKTASLDVAHRMFPSTDFKKRKDGDALLIAEYCRRTYK